MTNIEKIIKDIRPSLRLVAPQTFWFSMGFGIFNIIIGSSLYSAHILTTLNVVGVIPLNMWGVIFFTQGVVMLGALLNNNWQATRYMNIVGVAIKTAWWLELLSITITGRSPFLLIIWSLLLYLQIMNFIYFFPRIRDYE